MALAREELTPGTVRREGRWALGETDDGLFAVSRRCRHQLGDLSKGTVDAEGCLVCPWHQAAYDVATGTMVRGPRGFLGYHGATPGYSAMIQAVAKVVRLRVGRVLVSAGVVSVR